MLSRSRGERGNGELGAFVRRKDLLGYLVSYLNTVVSNPSYGADGEKILSYK